MRWYPVASSTRAMIPTAANPWPLSGQPRRETPRPTKESLRRGAVRKRVEDEAEERRLRQAVDWL